MLSIYGIINLHRFPFTAHMVFEYQLLFYIKRGIYIYIYIYIYIFICKEQIEPCLYHQQRKMILQLSLLGIFDVFLRRLETCVHGHIFYSVVVLVVICKVVVIYCWLYWCHNYSLIHIHKIRDQKIA